MTDLEIANQVEKIPIVEVAKKLGLSEKDLILYGNDKAKIISQPKKKLGKLILVTAMTPTPMGEGKTTVSIGVADALQKLGKSVCLSLREPSLGPVFGMKGGATGGGYSQVVPMEDINLHFTGDFHAIDACNNLISAAIYNHIYQGNELEIEKVIHQSSLDVNDRSLRDITISVKDQSYQTSFRITAASSIMTLFCLSKDRDDLRRRLDRMIVAYSRSNQPITVKDLSLTGALLVLLKDAFYPNLVQTLEGTPALIHGGPFANIAHGCSSIVATSLSMSLSDYTITEAGFGADLGAEKFLNIVCQEANIYPNVIVVVVTSKALKYHGGGNLEKGLDNLQAHLDHLQNYQVPIVVAINQFNEDKDIELELIKSYVEKQGYSVSVSTAYQDGGSGALNLAQKILSLQDKKISFTPLYKMSDSFEEKLLSLCEKVYHANHIEYSSIAKKALKKIKSQGLDSLPLCISKTQYSISDNPKKLGYPKNNSLFVKDIYLESGAGFITVLLGNTFLMPGLPKKPNYEKINWQDGKVIGLF